jgi:UDP-glucuronate decarboxylase
MMAAPDDFVGPVNIGNPGEFTMLELAKLTLELTGSKAKIVHLPRPKDDPSQRQPDITLAQQKLRWEPKVSLRDGLARTISYFKSINLAHFRKPTNHTAHKSSGM